MRYAKLLLVGISVLLATGCVAEKKLKLCRADNETLTQNVADQKTEMGRQEEAMNEIMTSVLNGAKHATVQLKQTKAELVKIRKKLAAANKKLKNAESQAAKLTE